MEAGSPHIKLSSLAFAGAVSISAFALAAVWLTGIELLPLALVTIVIAAFAVWQAFVRPYIWVILMVVGTFLGNVIYLAEGGVVPLTLFQLALFAAVFFIFLRRLAEHDFNFRFMGFEAELGLFLALIYLSLLWSPAPMDGFIQGTRLLISVFFLYIVFNEIRHEGEIIALFAVAVIVATFLALYALYQNLTDVGAAVESIMSQGTKLRGRATGTSHDPNRFATMFFIPLAFSACVFLADTKKKYKIIALAGLAISSGGLIVTYSRSAWIGAIIMILIITWYYRSVKLFVYVGLLGVILLIAFPNLSYTLFNVAQRFLDITAGTTDDSSRIRILLGIAGIGMFVDSYLIGVGYRGYPEKFTEYFSLKESIGVDEAHNVTYTILAELGIIGFLLFGLLFFKIIRVAYLNIRLSETETEKIISVTTLSTIIAYLVFYQFYGGGLNDNNLWLMVGLAFSIYYSSSDSGSKNIMKEQTGGKTEGPDTSSADSPPQ